MSDNNRHQMGLIHIILDGMHPVLKAVVFGILAIPLVLAISGMLLQLNVGKLIEQAIHDQSMYQLQAQRLEGDRVITAIQLSVDRVTNDLAILESRIDSNEQHIGQTRRWACDFSNSENYTIDKPVFCQ